MATDCIPNDVSSELGGISKADLIFVLAGVGARKAYGLRLYDLRRAPRILLSVGRFEIRKFSQWETPVTVDLVPIASAVTPSERHYFVLFADGEVRIEKISKGRFGTWSEIACLDQVVRNWLDVASIIIVSNSYHMKRIRICCRALLPRRLQIQFVALPDREKLGSREWFDRQGRILTECLKLPMYLLLWLFPKLNVFLK
jgi:uncharacterized SAM-binding protein YcdF (DUF218 family)